MKRIIGIFIIAISALAIINFDLFKPIFSPLSGDGSIQGHSWLTLKIVLSSLIIPGIYLLFSTHVMLTIKRFTLFLNGFSEKVFLFVALAIAMIVRLLVVIIFPLRLWSDYLEYHLLAQTWAEYGAYISKGLPTSYWPPGYPYFLSRIYLFFGNEPLYGVIANIFLGVIICLLTFLLAKKIFNTKTARLAMVISIFFPSQILFTNLLASELLFTCLFLGCFYFLIKKSSSTLSLYLSIMASAILLALSALTRPLTQIFPLIIIIILFIRFKRWYAVIPKAVIFIAVFIITLLPWMLRNSEELGTWKIATNGGVNLYIGNHSGAGYGWTNIDTTLFKLNQPSMEVTNDSLGMKLGVNYITKYPFNFIKRGFLKLGMLFASDIDALNYELIQIINDDNGHGYLLLAIITQGYYLIIILMAIMALLMLLKKSNFRKQSGIWLLLLTIIYWCGIHFIFFGFGRFHFPLLPLFSIFAAFYLVNKNNLKLTGSC